MEWGALDWWVLGLILVYLVLYQIFGVEPIVWIGYGVYGFALMIGNALWNTSGFMLDAWSEVKRVEVKPPMALQPPPTSVADFANYYHLTGAEVVQGFHRRRPIKVNLGQANTLISGSTGGGKTRSIHSWLIQWYSQGVRFTDNYKVFLVDLKGHQDDGLYMWEPVLDGYAQVQDGKIDQAIAMMNEIIRQISQKQTGGKRIILIIDEIANLTKWAGDKEGMDYLEQLVSQIRVIGNVIGSVQMGRHDIVATTARTQFSRRICFPARELSHVRLAMASSDIKQGQIPKKKGEFIMFDDESWTLIDGQTPFVDIWGESGQGSDIQRVIDKLMAENAETDPRLKLYLTVARNLPENGQIPGIQTVSSQLDWLKTIDIQYFYRNYFYCGAFRHGKNNAYYLNTDWRVGYGLVKKWTENEGMLDKNGEPLGWANEPPKVG